MGFGRYEALLRQEQGCFNQVQKRAEGVVGSKNPKGVKIITTNLPSDKLGNKRFGPFEIIEKVGRLAYYLKLPAQWSQVHPVFNIAVLTPWHNPYYTSQVVPEGPPPEVINDEPQWETERILDVCRRGQGYINFTFNGRQVRRLAMNRPERDRPHVIGRDTSMNTTCGNKPDSSTKMHPKKSRNSMSKIHKCLVMTSSREDTYLKGRGNITTLPFFHLVIHFSARDLGSLGSHAPHKHVTSIDSIYLHVALICSCCLIPARVHCTIHSLIGQIRHGLCERLHR